VPVADIGADGPCSPSGQSCAASGCCADPIDSCIPQGAGRVCAHAIPPPREGPACNGPSSSTLAGVHIELLDGRCSFTAAEAAAGIVVTYTLVIAADVPHVHPMPQDAGGCTRPSPASGLIVDFAIDGGGQTYCVCDVGPCPRPVNDVTANAGAYTGDIHWDGRNWSGPSDTATPEGARFPPGTYTLHVRATGTRDTSAGDAVPFAVSADYFLTIEP
jgi:hypothetical protein